VPRFFGVCFFYHRGDGFMPHLIPLHQGAIGSETVQTVNARELYEFLGVKQRFTDWVTKRIEQYGFEESRDFTRYYDSSNGNPHPQVDYFVSLDMAKELSMVERTKKGKEARLYFLDCEKQALAKPALPVLYDPKLQALALLIVEHDAMQHHLHEVEESTRQANAKAELAIANQQWLTIREYVFLNDLTHQMPITFHADYGRWLTGYCQEHGIPVRKQGVADRSWDQEHAYHIETIQKTLSGWLIRRHGQTELRIIKPQK
jgi:phage anti-repressor protein